MPLSDSQFQDIATALLESFMDQLEEQDSNAILELDLEDSALAIELEDGKQFLLSKHGPSKEMWLSSPVSGGLHFKAADDEAKQWKLPDGRELATLLTEEIAQLTGTSFTL